MFISTSQNSMLLIHKPVNVGFVSILHLPSDNLLRTILKKSVDYTMAKVADAHGRVESHLSIFL